MNGGNGGVQLQVQVVGEKSNSLLARETGGWGGGVKDVLLVVTIMMSLFV